MSDSSQSESPLPILALVSDLMFSSRISDEARAAGSPLKIVRRLAQLPDLDGRLLIVDLNQPGATAAAASWAQLRGRPVVGFVSHVDAAAIAEARAKGIVTIMARSKFVEALPGLVSPPMD